MPAFGAQVYSSPILRALETAAPLVAATGYGVKITVRPDIAEVSAKYCKRDRPYLIYTQVESVEESKQGLWQRTSF